MEAPSWYSGLFADTQNAITVSPVTQASRQEAETQQKEDTSSPYLI